MTKKVKLTREQAEAIERGIKIYGETRIMNDHEPDAWVGNLVNLNGITKDEMARALYIGYEVEETFNVGDWVVYDNGVRCGYKTNQIKDVDGQKAYFDEGRTMYLTSLRHATPEEIAEEKQRRWWAKHGRNVWELRRHDLISDKDGCSYTVNLIKEDYVEFVEFGMRKKTKEVKESFKVICFAEDRKDIKQ